LTVEKLKSLESVDIAALQTFASKNKVSNVCYESSAIVANTMFILI
jgi:hypothetical protein